MANGIWYEVNPDLPPGMGIVFSDVRYMPGDKLKLLKRDAEAFGVYHRGPYRQVPFLVKTSAPKKKPVRVAPKSPDTSDEDGNDT
jgi:hypothetical protein